MTTGWLAGMSAEGEPVLPKPPLAATRRPPATPPEEDWLGELDRSGDHPVPKGSRPPRPVAKTPSDPADSKRLARRAITHALAWAGGVATGLALVAMFRQAPPAVVSPPVVVSTDQPSKPAMIPLAQQTSSGDTRTQPQANSSPVPADRPPANTSATQAEGMVSPPMPSPSEPRPAPPRVEEPKPAPTPQPQLTPAGPHVINYNDYFNTPPPPR
jgi:hypothetical protein